MPRYLIVYLGGDQPSSPEEGKKHFAKYREWMKSLGAAAISPMNPIKDTRVVQPNGDVSAGGKTTMSGYTIVEADSMDDALAMAKSCPFLELNGSLEVSEMVEMPSSK